LCARKFEVLLMPSALLALEDGSLFYGESIGVPGQAVGEVVFNTAMTGYQEILTDPSYYKQIVTLTYPHIGNTGTNSEDVESSGVYAEGLIVRDCPPRASNFRATETLSQYLQRNGKVGICGIDTRRLTRLLRDKGAQNGCILAVGKGGKLDKKKALEAARAFPGLKGMDLAKVVSVREPYIWNEGVWKLGAGYEHRSDSSYHVVAFDYGIKRNILRNLTSRGCKVTVVPATATAQDVLKLNPDGVFLSNGPGDPEPCTYAIDAIKRVIASKIPVFGICLGHQLMGLASGARTIKMKFGHHGANHPVLDMKTGRVMISSQNHGFAVDPESLPANLRVTHKSLFDGSIQGLERTDAPAFCFQGHPEASPGPDDVLPLFDRFIREMEQHRAEAEKIPATAESSG
jgi:carbamoyl-phosphate synthase small subunit